MVGKAKIATFHYLIDKTWAKITNWKTKCLSTVGKEVLLKLELPTIPTYTMSIFFFFLTPSIHNIEVGSTIDEILVELQ